MAIRQYKVLPIAPLRIVGASHKTLSIAGRECFAAVGNTSASVKEIATACGLDNLAVISTCNRFECITFADEAAAERLQEYLLGLGAGSLRAKDFFTYQGEDACNHIFSVAAALDSLVLGETQILGQVKDAYRRAVAAGTANRLLHAVFQQSFRVAKKVRSQTAVSERGVSVSYVAVKLAEQIFDGLAGRKILLIGSGEMAELALLHLQAKGCEQVLIANRTQENAERLAARVHGQAVPLSDVPRLIHTVDVVIGSVHAAEPLLLPSSMSSMSDRSVLFIDCGMPRNFHPAIAEFDGVYLFNIDDLQAVADENKELRQEAARDADLLIQLAVHNFTQWLQRVEREPYLLDFRLFLQELCYEELQHGLGAVKEIDVGAERAIAKRIVERASLGFEQVLARYQTEEFDSVIGEPGRLDDELKIENG